MAKAKTKEDDVWDDEEKPAANVSGARLKSFLDRIERLEEEKKALSEDVRDIYGEAKATGFEPGIIRKIVALRKKSKEKRREEEELLELYLAAIGDKK